MTSNNQDSTQGNRKTFAISALIASIAIPVAQLFAPIISDSFKAKDQQNFQRQIEREQEFFQKQIENDRQINNKFIESSRIESEQKIQVMNTLKEKYIGANSEQQRATVTILSSLFPEVFLKKEVQLALQGGTDNKAVQLQISTDTKNIEDGRFQAIETIKEWLTNKKKIFAPPYDKKLLESILTGDRKKRALDALQNFLNKNIAYHYGDFTVIFVPGNLAVTPNTLSLVVDETENVTCTQNNQPIKCDQPSGKTRKTYYNLQKIGDKWKVAESRYLTE
jgi:ARC6-like, IMS domain